MTPLPILWAAAFLLVVGGIAKMRQPTSAVLALRAIGISAGRVAIVSLGLLEALIGAAALSGAWVGFDILVAFLYAAFAAFSARLTTVDSPGLSCGCAGARPIPPSLLHVALNVVAVLGAFAAAASRPALPGTFGMVVLTLGSAAIAYAAFLAVAYVPTLFDSYKGAR